MKNVIEIKNLRKKYDSFELGITELKIPSGCIIGLVGENGAGKTTFIKSILDIIKIDQGEIRIFEKEIHEKEAAIKQEIGVVLDQSFFPELLSPKDINQIMKSIYPNWDENLFQQYLNQFQIPFKKQMKTFSKGTRKKLEIAVALSHHPKMLILDEPTSGLDPIVRKEVLDIFLNFIKDEEHTVILSTHITSDLEYIADQIIFINQGSILLDKSRDEIFDQYAILKCGIKEFEHIKKSDIVRYQKNKYHYEILIKPKNKLAKKYHDYVIENITLEQLMLFMIKGESIC